MVKTSSTSVTQKRKPRVLWANPFCLLDTSSGASMTVRQMLLQLAAHGYDVQVLGATVFDNPKGMGRLKEQFPDLSAHQHQLIEAEDGPLTHQLVVSFSHNRNHFTTHEEGLWYSQYLYMLDSFKPDVVWFYGGQTLDMLIAAEARDRGIPVAFYLANGNYKAPNWCRDVDLILTDSQATAEMYRKTVGFTSKPVGKFIAPESFVAEHHERKRLLFVNPSWQKGASVFVQLAEKLERERPDIELEVVEARADWPAVLRETTRKMGEQRSALSNVVVTPNTSEMRGPYSRARVVVAPSLWWESSGRMLAEAMLNGIPALITNRGGMPEMIGDAGIAFDFPDACYKEPYQQLLNDDELQPLVDAVISLFDDEALYQDYVDRAWQVGKEKHHLARATDRLLTELTPLVNLRAGNKDFAIIQKKRHRQRLAGRASKPEFKVDNSLQQLISPKSGTKGNNEPQANRLCLTDDFTWQIKGKIMVLDNRASLIKSGLADQMAATEAFGIVAFDPASEIKDTKQYEGSDYIQVFQHALLGDGKVATLHACVAPEMTSTLTPLSAEKLPKRHHLGAKPLAEMPINTVALDSIDGLGNLDWLILDELSDAMAVLEHGKKSLTDTLLIQARVAFQLTHEKQPNLAELQHWASRNGFRFYRFHNISHYSHLPEKLSAQTACATEQESGDVLFLPSHERMATLSEKERMKLAFILSAGFAAHDVAFDLIAEVSQEKALEFLEAQELLPKAPGTQNASNKDVLVPHRKHQLPSEETKLNSAPEAIIAPQPESQCQIDLDILEKQLTEVLSHLAFYELTQNYAAKVVELSEKLRWVNDENFAQKSIAKIYKEFSKKKDSIPLFYLLTNSLLNNNAKITDSKSLRILEERLEVSGWKDKTALYSFWLENIQDDRLASQSKKFTVVIICNKYKKETYENIIELRHQCGVDGEIVFVNNGDKSNDARALAALVDVYVELKGNSGAYLARNIGSAFSNGNILIFVDDDGLPEKEMLAAHAEVHSKYILDAVRGSYLPKNPNETPPSHYHLGDKPLVALNSLEGNCSYRRDLFFKIRGWGDYILFGHGGAELYVRLISHGSDQSKHIYIPGCILRHDYYRGEKHAKNKRKKQAESAYLLSARNHDIDPMVSGFLKKMKVNKRKIFLVGFPKSGTSTIHKALEETDYKSAHWKVKEGFVGQLMYKGLYEKDDPLHYLQCYDAITQGDVCLPTHGLNYWPNLDFELIKKIQQKHPDCLFILNYRNPEKTVSSINRWSDMKQRFKQSEITGLPTGKGSDEELEKWIVTHMRKVREYFSDNENFIEVDIEDVSAPEKLGEKLGEKLAWWGVANRNKSLKKSTNEIATFQAGTDIRAQADTFVSLLLAERKADAGKCLTSMLLQHDLDIVRQEISAITAKQAWDSDITMASGKLLRSVLPTLTATEELSSSSKSELPLVYVIGTSNSRGFGSSPYFLSFFSFIGAEAYLLQDRQYQNTLVRTTRIIERLEPEKPVLLILGAEPRLLLENRFNMRLHAHGELIDSDYRHMETAAKQYRSLGMALQASARGPLYFLVPLPTLSTETNMLSKYMIDRLHVEFEGTGLGIIDPFEAFTDPSTGLMDTRLQIIKNESELHFNHDGLEIIMSRLVDQDLLPPEALSTPRYHWDNMIPIKMGNQETKIWNDPARSLKSEMTAATMMMDNFTDYLHGHYLQKELRDLIIFNARQGFLPLQMGIGLSLHITTLSLDKVDAEMCKRLIDFSGREDISVCSGAYDQLPMNGDLIVAVYPDDDTDALKAQVRDIMAAIEPAQLFVFVPHTLADFNLQLEGYAECANIDVSRRHIAKRWQNCRLLHLRRDH